MVKGEREKNLYWYLLITAFLKKTLISKKLIKMFTSRRERGVRMRQINTRVGNRLFIPS